jgi:hypothetical protein
MIQHKPPRRSRFAPLLPEFEPIEILWTGAAAPYPSEQAARWQLRQLRPALLEAGALAYHRGRLLIHPQRHAQVVEREAVEAAKRRAQQRGA